MINLYIIHVKFWQNYFIGKDRSSPIIIVKIKNVAIATFFSGAVGVVIYNFFSALITIDTNINQFIYRLSNYFIKIK